MLKIAWKRRLKGKGEPGGKQSGETDQWSKRSQRGEGILAKGKRAYTFI